MRPMRKPVRDEAQSLAGGLRAARALAGITQSELAKRAKCSRKTIYTIETTGDCRHSTLRRIARALGTTVEGLIRLGAA
jgi:DNA-binding XRE family transcriptional regulator